MNASSVSERIHNILQQERSILQLSKRIMPMSIGSAPSLVIRNKKWPFFSIIVIEEGKGYAVLF